MTTRTLAYATPARPSQGKPRRLGVWIVAGSVVTFAGVWCIDQWHKAHLTPPIVTEETTRGAHEALDRLRALQH